LHAPAIPAPGRPRQEDLEFQVSVGCITRPCLKTTTTKKYMSGICLKILSTHTKMQRGEKKGWTENECLLKLGNGHVRFSLYMAYFSGMEDFYNHDFLIFANVFNVFDEFSEKQRHSWNLKFAMSLDLNSRTEF
jgi:hypothetical protein